MSKIIYGYWNLRGVAEPCRYLLHCANVDFEDKRYVRGSPPDYTSDEWKSNKFNLGLDFPNLPYLIDGDVKLTQSITILRYLARKYNMVGENEAETLRIELAEQQLDDVRYDFYRFVCFNYEKEKENYLKALPEKLEQLSKFLGDRKFIAGGKLTYVDFILYEVLDFHRIFSASCLDAYENLMAFLERFESIPAIEKYMKSGKFSRLPVAGRFTF